MELNIGNDPNDEHQPAVSNSMMSAIVPLWVFSSCKKLYGNKLRGVHLCAGGLGTDTCQVCIINAKKDIPTVTSAF